MSHFITKFADDQLVWDVEFGHVIPEGSSVVSGVLSATSLNDLSDATNDVLANTVALIDGTIARMRLKGGVKRRLYNIKMLLTLDTSSGGSPDELQQDITLRIRP